MFLQVFLSKYVGAESNVGEDQVSDPHHFKADPEPAFQFNAGPDSSAFQYPVSQSGTRAFRYRTGSTYSGTVLVSAFGIFVHSGTGLTRCRTDIPAF
jgi:hypothetical protein